MGALSATRSRHLSLRHPWAATLRSDAERGQVLGPATGGEGCGAGRRGAQKRKSQVVARVVAALWPPEGC
eukprot:12803521-Alexandrium_andersonii.AAC.1